MKVLLIDDDLEFRKRFSNYIAVNCDAIMLSVTGGSVDKQDVKRMISESELVLIDEKTEGFDEFFSEGIGEWVVLTGRKQEIDRSTAFAEEDAAYKTGGNMLAGNKDKIGDSNCTYVYKFQSAPDILRSIPQLALYADISASHKFSSSKMSIAVVSGFSGGCGRTGLALTLARFNQQKMKKNTLVISLAQISDINDYFIYNGRYKAGYEFLGGNIGNIRDPGFKQDINMLLLNFVSGASVNPAKFIIKEGSGVSTFILPSDLKNDIVDLDGIHMKRFIKYIDSWQLFDTVIFDMDNGLNDKNLAVYEVADKIFLLSNAGRYKKNSEILWEELIMGRSGVSGVFKIMNFCGETNTRDHILLDEEFYDEKDIDFMLPWD